MWWRLAQGALAGQPLRLRARLAMSLRPTISQRWRRASAVGSVGGSWPTTVLWEPAFFGDACTWSSQGARSRMRRWATRRLHRLRPVTAPGARRAASSVAFDQAAAGDFDLAADQLDLHNPVPAVRRRVTKADVRRNAPAAVEVDRSPVTIDGETWNHRRRASIAQRTSSSLTGPARSRNHTPGTSPSRSASADLHAAHSPGKGLAHQLTPSSPSRANGAGQQIAGVRNLW